MLLTKLAKIISQGAQGPLNRDLAFCVQIEVHNQRELHRQKDLQVCILNNRV